jgi:hypothetical protein
MYSIIVFFCFNKNYLQALRQHLCNRIVTCCFTDIDILKVWIHFIFASRIICFFSNFSSLLPRGICERDIVDGKDFLLVH